MMGKDDDVDPAVLQERINALEARLTKLEEAGGRVLWAFVAAAALLIWEPLRNIVLGVRQ